MVLKFVIVIEIEFILGYIIYLYIVFDKYSVMCLLISNMCVNKLMLLVGGCMFEDCEEVFKFFDYVFISEYFGNI